MFVHYRLTEKSTELLCSNITDHIRFTILFLICLSSQKYGFSVDTDLLTEIVCKDYKSISEVFDMFCNLGYFERIPIEKEVSIQ